MEGQKPPKLRSLSPEEGSSASSASQHAEPLPERRLLPRLALSGEQFRLTSNGKIFGVADLSVTGMALRLLELNDRLLFPVGTHFSGMLNVNRTKHSVAAVVKNLRGDHVGCQFVNVGSELHTELRQWLDPVQLGNSLRLMPQGASSESIWYNGRSGTEMIVWPRENALARIWIVLWGQEFVEWDHATGVRTGELKLGPERDSVQGVLRWAPEWLVPDAAPDLAKLNLAKTILLSSKLPEHWKHEVQSGLVPPV